MLCYVCGCFYLKFPCLPIFIRVYLIFTFFGNFKPTKKTLRLSNRPPFLNWGILMRRRPKFLLSPFGWSSHFIFLCNLMFQGLIHKIQHLNILIVAPLLMDWKGENSNQIMWKNRDVPIVYVAFGRMIAIIRITSSLIHHPLEWIQIWYILPFKIHF
jgi:hypothetical protein